MDLDTTRELPTGALIEIEDGPMLYLGELEEWNESRARIRVEHVLDRLRLANLRAGWE